MNRIARLSEEQRKELADYYENLIEQLDLSVYKKSSEICEILKISGREWRKHVENMQHLYMADYLEKLIVGNTKGYIYTDDFDLIFKVLRRKENQFKSMAYNTYHLKKVISHNDNLTIKEFLSSMGD